MFYNVYGTYDTYNYAKIVKYFYRLGAFYYKYSNSLVY